MSCCQDFYDFDRHELKARREALVANILPAMRASERFGIGPTTDDVYLMEAFKEADRIIAESDRRERQGQ